MFIEHVIKIKVSRLSIIYVHWACDKNKCFKVKYYICSMNIELCTLNRGFECYCTFCPSCVDYKYKCVCKWNKMQGGHQRLICQKAIAHTYNIKYLSYYLLKQLLLKFYWKPRCLFRGPVLVIFTILKLLQSFILSFFIKTFNINELSCIKTWFFDLDFLKENVRLLFDTT